MEREEPKLQAKVYQGPGGEGRGGGGHILQYNGALAVQERSAEKGYLSQDSGNSKVGNSRIISPVQAEIASVSTDLRALNQNVLKRRADWLSKLEGGYPVLFTSNSVNNIVK